MNGNVIEIAGKKFAIDASIPIEVNSDFSDNERLVIEGKEFNPQGTINFPFTHRCTPEFLKACGFPQVLQLYNRPLVVEGVNLYSDGTLVTARARMKVEIESGNMNTGETTASLTIMSDRSIFNALADNKKLHQIPMHSPINIPGYTFEDWKTAAGINYEEDLPQTYFFVQDIVSGNDTGVLNANRTPLDYYKYFGTADWMEQEHINQDYADWFCFPTIQTGDEGLAMYKLNYFDPKSSRRYPYLYGIPRTYVNAGKTVHYMEYPDAVYHYSPQYYYKRVLVQAFASLGYTLKGGLLDDPDFNKLLLMNNRSIVRHEAIRLPLPSIIDTTTLFYYQKGTTIDARNHLPDITVREFISDFKISFNIALDVIGNEVYMKYVDAKKVLNIPLHQVSPKYKIGIIDTAVKIAYTLDEKFQNPELYEPYVSRTAENYQEYTMSIPPVELIDNSIVVNIDSMPLPLAAQLPYMEEVIKETMDTVEFSDGVWFVAGTNGNALRFNSVVKENERLANVFPKACKGIYYGLDHTFDFSTLYNGGDTSYVYPLASPLNYRPDDSLLDSGYNLRVTGTDSLTDEFWKSLLQALSSVAKVELYFDWDNTDLSLVAQYNYIIIRGRKYYIAKKNYNQPIRELVTVIGYEVID